MSIELEAVSFRSPNPQGDAEFWGAILHRPLEIDQAGILLAGGPTQVGIRFTDGQAHGVEKNRLHLHLTEGNRSQRETIAACLASGARLLGNGHIPENSHAILADAVGDEFCVIEDGNAYLAGCGPLGEVTCDGTRAVGLFWSRVLGWALVWDEAEETAIQSPAGGTKIAWSGDPVNPKTIRERQYFTLTVSDGGLDEELDRLIALGAAAGGTEQSDAMTLIDPDGNAFVVRTSDAYP